MTIGDRIKEKRISQGKTLEYVASIVNVGRATIHKYENNIITTIPSNRIELLAIALDTTPAYLLGWEDERDKKSPPPDDGSGLNESEQKLIELFHKVPEDKQKMVIDMIRVALESL